ncbi:MAG: hypothetical protein J5857_12245 [Treponema sp.]|nr:hypothetical protein [Treponema sp.]
MSRKEIQFSSKELTEQIDSFASRGITELVVHDRNLSRNREAVISLCRRIAEHDSELFISIPVEVGIIDASLIQAVQEIYCSLEIPLKPCVKGTALLFDKKFFSSRIEKLNRAELVFGFDMDFASCSADTYKAFRDRLDFAISLYPNHIDFEQLELSQKLPQSTAFYSSRDIECSRDIAFACAVFYSEGRAVPWFNPVIKALKISPSAFLADFAEWQRCNNCSIDSSFKLEEAVHEDIEKMQLLFLQEKFEEKKKRELFTAVSDIVRLNGAMSRALSDGLESIVETSYSPDDVFSSSAFDIQRFCDSVTMENTRTKIFLTPEGPDYRILQ